ncbi:MAG: hypothetical protein ABI664_08990 [bacterium]
MTTAGLVGGLGPESTIDYYRRVLAVWAAHDPSMSSLTRLTNAGVDFGTQEPALTGSQ